MPGIQHIDVGSELSRAEWEGTSTHELASGTSFPGTPGEMDLFYRSDEHIWYVYNGTGWVDLTSQGNDLGAVDESIIPDTANAYDLGSGTYEWKDFYLAGTIYMSLDQGESIRGSSDTMIFGVAGADELILSATALYPNAASGLDLGTTTYPFKDAYFTQQVYLIANKQVWFEESGGKLLFAISGATRFELGNNFFRPQTSQYTLGGSGQRWAIIYGETVDLEDLNIYNDGNFKGITGTWIWKAQLLATRTLYGFYSRFDWDGLEDGYDMSGEGVHGRISAINTRTYKRLAGVGANAFSSSTVASGQEALHGFYGTTYLSSAGTVDLATGIATQTYISSSGTITLAIGGDFLVNIPSAATGDIVDAYGVRARILNEASATAEIATAYGLYTQIDKTGGGVDFTTAYGVYVDVDPASVSGTAYGIYIADAELNIIDGDLNPLVANTWDLGGVDNEWKDLYLAGTIKLFTDQGETIRSDGSTIIWAVATTDELKLSGSALYPVADAGLDLGTTTLRYGTVFADDLTLTNTPYPTIRDSQKNLQLTTTSETEICAYTVDATDRIMRVAVFFRVVTATTTVTVKIYYTNAASQAVTCTLVDAKSLAVNDYTYAPLIFEIDASTEISLKVTAGTANQVYVTGTIEEMV